MAKKTVRSTDCRNLRVGSIIDLNGEGFVIKDTSLWQSRDDKYFYQTKSCSGKYRAQGFPDTDNRSFIPLIDLMVFCSNRGQTAQKVL